MAEEAEEQNGVMVWPSEQELTRAWENNSGIRQSFREHGHLLIWPKKELVGTASLRTLSMNRAAVEEALRVWAAASPTAKSPPVQWLKHEALF